MIWLVIAGVLLLAAAALLAFFGRRAAARAAAIAGTPTSSCADVRALVGAGQPPAVVELVGGAAPVESLTAPFSGRPCVWYRSVVTHHYWDWDWDRDAQGNRRRERVRRRRVVSDQTSPGHFALRDATGKVLVDPREAKVDRPLQVHDQFEGGQASGIAWMVDLGFGAFGGGDDTIGYQREEWVIAPEDPLYVLGAADGSGATVTIVKPPSGELLISTRSEEELVSASRQRMGWLYAGAGAAALVGVGLLVGAALT